VDLSSERLALAEQQGATETMLGGADVVERIREKTGGFGAEYTFEATGSVEVMAQAVAAARMGWGECVLCGVAGAGETLDLVPRLLITGRKVTGCELGGLPGRTGVARLVDRWMAGDLAVDSLVSHRLSLTEIDRGFELMLARNGIRSIIVFPDT
jgi:S-(hydroxymethyl)glutathione dehydrogenase/alcohol dehydrogenase